MPQELFDVVDEADHVIGVAPRSEVHARRWWHRAVHIFVRNTRGELLIHLRTPTKDEYPNCYTSSASGHVDSGETYSVAAQRELREELGLAGPLRELQKFPASAEMCYEHTMLYELTTDQAPQFDPGEIASGEFLPLPTIAERVAAAPEQFTPCFRTLFAWYLAQQTA